MEELKNCKICGRVFASFFRGDLCPECLRADEENYYKVRTYLKELPGSSLFDVSENTGVNERTILKYLREGRLELLEAIPNFLVCVHCGKPIKSGMFCDECTKFNIAEIKKLYGANPDFNDLDISFNKNAKMHLRRNSK